VTRAEFERTGLRWPLTVDQGRIGCDGVAAWFRTDDGRTYGLNGAATGSGFPPIEPIWAIDEKTMGEFNAIAKAGQEVPVVRVSIADMISEANKHCF
jgi:formyltetrahydrofolate synthetase